MTPDLAPVAQQARSRHTQERILRASFEVIAESGVEALTVGAISERAGVAVGSLYRRFGDKDNLLLAVQTAFAEQVTQDVTRRLGTSTSETEVAPGLVVAHAVCSVVGSFRAHQRLLRVFLLLGTSNARVREAGSRSSVDGKHAFEVFLCGVKVRHHDRDAAVDFAYRLIYSTLAHRVTQGEMLESHRPLSWDDLEAQLVDTVCRYLLDS